MSRLRMVLVGVALGACAPAPNFAGLEMTPRRAELRERIVTRTLGNGLHVVLLPDMRTNLVMVGMHYTVGGSDDPRDGAGLAHYVEHILFDAAFHGEDGKALRDVGLDANAMTSLDRTFFYLTALESEIDGALEVQARRLEAQCPTFDDAALERERDVVIEENKLRANRNSIDTALQQAVWGASHPYGHGAAGSDFAKLPRARFCEFIDQHYGPSSAVLVVSGHIPEDAMERVIQRYGHIPARPTAKRESMPSPIGTPRLVVKGLERPTAVVMFDAPAAGTDADAAVDALDGRSWRLTINAQARYAQTFVLGEDRQRVVVAMAETEDAKFLEVLVSAITDAITKHERVDVELYRQHKRASLISRLDDTFAAVPEIAASVARGERPSRFHALHQLDKLSESQITHWFDGRKGRAALLLPQVGTAGTLHLGDVATSLHHLEVLRGPAGSVEPPIRKRPFAVTDYRLANGMRVVLAPDPDAIAMDARLVITGTDEPTGLDLQAALFLEANPEDLARVSVRQRMAWYAPAWAPVVPDADNGATTFRIQGMAIYADWHVWNLALSILRGTYANKHLDEAREVSERRRQALPSAAEVIAKRLAGHRDVKKRVSIHSASELQTFRQARYSPDLSALIVCGNFDEEAMRKEISSLFGDWRPIKHGATTPGRDVLLTPVGIRKDDSSTVELAVAFTHAAPAGTQETVASDVLIELLDMRLRVVREGLGATYGIHTFGNRTTVGAYGSVEPAYAAQAAEAIAKELELIRGGDLSLTEDFVRARKKVLARALALPSGASSRADALQRIVIAGGKVQDLTQQVEDLRSLDYAAVQSVAARYLMPNASLVAARGDQKAVETALATLGAAKDKIEWITAPQGGRL